MGSNTCGGCGERAVSNEAERSIIQDIVTAVIVTRREDIYLTGALVYATRIPERWMPGKFDIAGHSHQLFHVLVVAGAFTHYRAGLVYLKWRDIEGC
uniref:At4g38290 n=1 Tax=Arabidopsis thaliana TaxID=3702 RepID=A2RVJ5_ARATH|nr:At4g38290 [Arabidopsis thaliana]